MRSSTPRNPPASPSRSRGGASTGGGPANRGRNRARGNAPVSRPPRTTPSPRVAVSTGAEIVSLNEERRELVCSVIGLSVKLGLVVMAGVSLCRLAGAYQARMERQAELSAVLEIEQAQLAKARDRFDQLFMVAGEQKLIREQSQWIAPNRLRVVWQTTDPLQERPALAMQTPPARLARP